MAGHDGLGYESFLCCAVRHCAPATATLDAQLHDFPAHLHVAKRIFDFAAAFAYRRLIPLVVRDVTGDAD
jgi:hypothetical protein